MAQFLHIYIEPKKGVTREQVEGKLNLALDWYRYNQGLYVVYTTSNEAKWQERLKNFIEPDGEFFICRLDVTRRAGFMEKDFWEWLQAKQKHTKERAAITTPRQGQSR